VSLLYYWETWGAHVVRAVSRMVNVWFGFETRDDDQVADGLPYGLRQRARQAVWRLRRAYDEAAEDGAFDDLMAAFRQLAPESGEIKTALIKWIHLLEVLIQEAETQYGSAPGLGELKADQVKAAMLYLLLQENIAIPNLPRWITPLVLEFGTEWLIDSVVALLNQNELWEQQTAPRPKIGIVSRLLRWLTLLASWARRSALFLRLGDWLERLSRRAVLVDHPLAPAVKAAADDLLDSGVLDVRRGVRRAGEVIGWIRGHRRQVVALIELVSVAVHEAEAFLEMPGPEKKAYAREVVLALLSDEGIIGSPDGLGYLITEWILDWAIDAVVSLFHRRSLFHHRTRRSAA
jgi:hypothetical protein